MYFVASIGSFPLETYFRIPTSKIQNPEDLRSINNVPIVPRSPSVPAGARPAVKHKQPQHLSASRALSSCAKGKLVAKNVALRRQTAPPHAQLHPGQHAASWAALREGSQCCLRHREILLVL